MSSLEWGEAFFARAGVRPAVPELYYELWVVGQDRTAWYNLPAAYIYRVKERRYELDIHGRIEYYTSLKAAKAMGIALVRMDDAV